MTSWSSAVTHRDRLLRQQLVIASFLRALGPSSSPPSAAFLGPDPSPRCLTGEAPGRNRQVVPAAAEGLTDEEQTRLAHIREQALAAEMAEVPR